MSARGNVVILGGCGVCITDDIPRSLHLRLVAPVEYRVKNVMSWKMLSRNGALALMEEIDRKRALLRDEFAGRKFDHHKFDLWINLQRFAIKEAVLMTMQAVKMHYLV